MKIVTEQEQSEHRAATIRGGLTGAALGIGLTVPAHFFLQTRPFYRQIPITLKALGAVCLILPSMSVSAEKAGEAYDRSRWVGVGKRELDNLAQREEARWQSLSVGQKASDWAQRHKYGMIAGSWAASMGLAFGLVARSPQSFAQKIVQARMWAQGLTVGTLIGSAVLTGISSGDKTIQPKVDHSWLEILEQEGDEISKEDRQALREIARRQRASV